MSKKKPCFSYTKLKDLSVEQQEAHVFGLVVTFVASAPNGDGYSCSFTLVDEDKLPVDCNMSHSDAAWLPHSMLPGDILCLRKVLVEGQEKHVALKASAHSCWMMFGNNNDFKPHTCYMNFKLGSVETTRVNQLKLWSSQEALTGTKNRRLRPPWSESSQSNAESSHNSSPSSSRHDHTPSTPGTCSPRTRSTLAYVAHTHYSHAAGNYPSPTPHIDNSTVLPRPGGRVSRPSKARFYDAQLTPIAELVSGKKEAGVMGIVKYFKPPFRSKGSDCCTVFSLIDDSQNSAHLSCVLFNPKKEDLPVICCSGEVFMVKGLTIQTYQTALQGVGYEGSLVGLFPIDLTLPSPETIGNWYTMKAMEKSRLHQLKKWAAATELPLLINSKLEDITVGNYCSTLCAVVAVHRAPTGRGVVLTVTDGTVPKYPLAADTSSMEVLGNDPVLHYKYQGITGTVVVSTASQPHVTAGDVVQLVDLCMVKMFDRTVPSLSSSGHTHNPEVEEVMELVIEDHPSYQGAVKVQHSGSTVACSFKSEIAVPEGPYPSWRLAQSPLSTQVLCDISELATLKHIQWTAPVGSVHVVQVKVVGVGRSVCSKLEEMSQLRCPRCKTLYLTPQPQAENYHQLLCAGDLCVCCCPEDGREDEAGEEIALRFIYAFTLLVVDRSAQLELAVSGTEGSKFLRQEPANLYSDLPAKDALLSLMYQMTGGNDPFLHVPLDPRFSLPRPPLRLCITVATSYTGKRLYKLSNTILLQDDV